MFRIHGHTISMSSKENHFLLMDKGGSITSVGYSAPGQGPTEGEAEMFLSMAMNESSHSMIFITPSEIGKEVSKLLVDGGAEIWNRTTLAMKLGELQLMRDEAPEKKKEGGSMFDLFSSDEDIDPVKELRTYQQKEIGGFRVHDVDLGRRQPPASPDIWEEVRSLGQEISEEIGSRDDTEAPGTPEGPLKEKEAVGDDGTVDPLPMMGMFEEADTEKKEEIGGALPILDMPLVTPPAEEKKAVPSGKKGKAKAKKVPEEVLMNPWAGFDNWKTTNEELPPPPPKKKKKAPVVEGSRENPWLGSIKLPLKYSKKKAISLASKEEDVELDHRFLPFLLIRATYELESRDTGEVLGKEGTYLYNSITSRVTDVPLSLFDEMVSVGERWKGEGSPDKLSDPKKGYNKALAELRKRISESDLAMDRKVRETLMATIYREIKYRFKAESFKVESSKRLMIPFWIKKGEKGDAEWMVDGYLGRFISPEETG